MLIGFLWNSFFGVADSLSQFGLVGVMEARKRAVDNPEGTQLMPIINSK